MSQSNPNNFGSESWKRMSAILLVAVMVVMVASPMISAEDIGQDFPLEQIANLPEAPVDMVEEPVIIQEEIIPGDDVQQIGSYASRAKPVVRDSLERNADSTWKGDSSIRDARLDYILEERYDSVPDDKPRTGSSTDQATRAVIESPVIFAAPPQPVPNAPTNVALFQENNPWGFDAIQQTLIANAIPYTIYNTGDIGVVNLAPFDKVIIGGSDDQGIGFYNAVAANTAWFEAYANTGGVVEIHDADRGGFNTLPFGLVATQDYPDAIDITIPNHPLITTPNVITDGELDGWSSSAHRYFTSMPAGTTPILTEGITGFSYPVLIAFDWGSGKVIASGQTLEWAWGFGYSNIIENIILDMGIMPTYLTYMTPSSQIDLGTAGTSVNYLIEINNIGTGPDTYDLSASGNAWPVSFWSMPIQMQNPSFETGDFTGWDAVDMVAPFYPLQVDGAGNDPWGGWFNSAPTDGVFSVQHGFDGGGPGNILVGQNVYVPAIGSSSVEFDYRAAWDTTFGGASQDRTFSVHVEPAGGGAPMQTDVLLTAEPFTTEDDTGILHGVVDLTTFAGSTVYVHFDWWIPEDFTGPGWFEMDNVVIVGQSSQITQIGPLNSDEVALFVASVNIPGGAGPGDFDTADITADSQNDGTLSHTVDVTTHVPVSIPFYDGFESPTLMIFDDDNVNAGTQWERGNPAAYGAGPGGAYAGTNCMGSNLLTEYLWGADCFINLPPVDMAGVPSAELNFWHWYQIDGNSFGEFDNEDGGWVEASTDGTTWEQITPVGGYPDTTEWDVPPDMTSYPCFASDSGGWVYSEFDLTQYAGDYVWLRFRFWSEPWAEMGYPGWYIDEVNIDIPPPYDCDLNPDMQSSYGLRGASTDYSLNIENTGLFPDTYDLSASGNAWPVSFWTSPQQTIIEEDFEGNFPPTGWTAMDWAGWGDPVGEWHRNDLWGYPNNAGDGFCAEANSDLLSWIWTGSGGIDVSLETPHFNLDGYATATLEFDMSYLDMFWWGDDYVEIWVNADGMWFNIAYYDWDVSPMGPGERISLDLTPFIGATDVYIEYYYYDNWEWCGWLQIDNVHIFGDTGIVPTQITSIDIDSRDNSYFTARVDVPAGAAPGDIDIADITVTSQNDPPVLDGAQTITHVPYRGGLFEDFDGSGGPGGYTDVISLSGPPTYWEVGDPSGWGPGTAYSGTNCAGTNIDDMYYQDANILLVSPYIELFVGESYLSFYQWYEMWTMGDDGGFVEISVNGGNWLQIDPVGGYPTGGWMGGYITDGYSDGTMGWEYEEYDLTPFAGNVIQLRFHFASSPWWGGQDGWYVDDINIVPPPPYAFESDPVFQIDYGAIPSEVDHEIMIRNIGYNPDTYDLEALGNVWPVTFWSNPTTIFINEDFEGVFPPIGWSIQDYQSYGTSWLTNTAVGSLNYAGGIGQCADANNGPWMMNTGLTTPSFSLAGQTTATLEFDMSYDDWDPWSHPVYDYAEVRVSTNGGGTWTPIAVYDEDHSPYGTGEHITLDLTPFVGSPSVILNFHYTNDVNPTYYWQIDNVEVYSNTGMGTVPITSIGPISNGEIVNLNARVGVPPTANIGDFDMAAIFVTSQGDPMIFDVPVVETRTAFGVPINDNMESGVGDWDTWDDGGGTVWELGDPAGGVGPGTAASPTNCWGTNLLTDYTLPSEAYLTTPIIKLGPGHQVLKFDHWYQIDGNTFGDFDDEDGGWLEITTNEGASWNQIFPVEGYNDWTGDIPTGYADLVNCYAGNSGGWIPAEFDLSAWADSGVQLRFRFWTEPWVESGWAGWYIDNVYIGVDMYEVDLVPDNDYQWSTTNTAVYYPMTVFNMGTEPDIYDIFAIGNNWVTRFWDGNTLITDTGVVPAGGSFDFVVEVLIPSVGPGSWDDVDIRVVSRMDPFFTWDESNLWTDAEPQYWFQADPPVQTVFGWYGDYVDHLITIENQGTEEDFYALMYEDTEWLTRFYTLDLREVGIYNGIDDGSQTWWIGPILPGQQKSFVARVLVQSDIPGDFDRSTIRITSISDTTVVNTVEIITRTSMPAPFFDNFELAGSDGVFGRYNDGGPLGQVDNAWTRDDNTFGGVGAQTSFSGTHSMYTDGGPLTITSCMINLEGAQDPIFSAWVQRGDDGFSEDPDINQDLIIEYRNDLGDWVHGVTYPGDGVPGEVNWPFEVLPDDARHPRFQVRFTQPSASVVGETFWHIDDVYIGPATPNFDLTPNNMAQDNFLGNPVEYAMQIQNNARHVDVYDITTIGNWPSWGPGPLGPVAPGDIVTFSVFVDIPAGLPVGDFDTTNVIATSQLNPGAFSDTSVLTTTYGEPNPILTPDTAMQMGDTGTTVEYLMNIENGAIFADTFDLTAVGGIPGFPTTLLDENFEGAFPPAGWTVTDNEADACIWMRNDAWGEGNYITSGETYSACVSSDAWGPGVEFDTELISPPFSLVGASTAALDYDANYQNFGSQDFFDVDISTDGGGSWTTLLSWNEDHGGFRTTPSEHVTLDLAAYIGQPNVNLRFYHYDPNVDDWNWYVEVDNIIVSTGFPTSIWNAAGTVEIDQIGPLAPSANQNFLVRVDIPAGTEGIHVDSTITATSQWDNAFFDSSIITTYATPAAPFFSDDFADGNYNGWTVVDEGIDSGPSAWNAGTTVLRQTSNIHTGGAFDAPKWSGSYIWTGDTSWDNYAFRADLGSTDDNIIGMLGRYTDSNNYYRFMWGHQNRDYDITTPGTQRRMLDVNVDGVWTTLASDDVIYIDDGTMYTVEMQFIDDRIMVFIDGNLIFDVVDDSHSNGAIALFTWGNSNGRYDNVEAYAFDTASITSPIGVMDEKIIDVISSDDSSPNVFMTIPDADAGTSITMPEQEKEETATIIPDIKPVNDLDITVPLENTDTISSEPINEDIIMQEQSNPIVFPSWIIMVAMSMAVLAGFVIYRRRKD